MTWSFLGHIWLFWSKHNFLRQPRQLGQLAQAQNQTTMTKLNQIKLGQIPGKLCMLRFVLFRKKDCLRPSLPNLLKLCWSRFFSLCTFDNSLLFFPTSTPPDCPVCDCGDEGEGRSVRPGESTSRLLTENGRKWI